MNADTPGPPAARLSTWSLAMKKPTSAPTPPAAARSNRQPIRQATSDAVFAGEGLAVSILLLPGPDGLTTFARAQRRGFVRAGEVVLEAVGRACLQGRSFED